MQELWLVTRENTCGEGPYTRIEFVYERVGNGKVLARIEGYPARHPHPGDDDYDTFLWDEILQILPEKPV